MKLKNIICTALTAILAVGATSCEDMLKVDSRVVLYDYQNTLNYATDTVYSVMGIISKMQAIADRAVILNEVRGDLVSTTDRANVSLKELYDWDFTDKNNVYDNPADYYAVINNCNFFLAHADTAYVRNHKNIFLKEYIAVLSYRAWTYLQLAQAYGKVYFVNEPIVSADQADESKLQLLDIKQLATVLLDDFEQRFLDYDIPNYGNLAGGTNGDGTTSETHNSQDLFIPVRIIMGDLYLWAGQYEKAALSYAEYLTDLNDRRATGTASALWFDKGFLYLGDDNYSNQFGKNMKPICYIPMEADVYGGVVSDLPNIFNSTEDNDYWHQLTSSRALVQLSADQEFCFYFENQTTHVVQSFYNADKLTEPDMTLRGDLRLRTILTSSTAKADEVGVGLNRNRQTLAKIYPEKISIYRNDVVYLRLAEALNRCGLSKTAFAILKYGLNYITLHGLLGQSGDVNTFDFCSDSIKAQSMGLGDIYREKMFNNSYFYPARLYAEGGTAGTTWRFTGRVKTNGTGVPYTADYFTYREPESYNTFGIHSRGCGCSEANGRYIIPADVDTMRYVEELIVNEMALETCFEGYRFGDLLRVSMHRAEDQAYPSYGGFADNAFLAEKVAMRKTGVLAERDETLYTKLLGDGKSFNENWFLKLKKQ